MFLKKHKMKVYGILDPDVNNFNLMLWSNTEIKEIKKSYQKNKQSETLENSR